VVILIRKPIPSAHRLFAGRTLSLHERASAPTGGFRYSGLRLSNTQNNEESQKAITGQAFLGLSGNYYFVSESGSVRKGCAD